MRRHAVVAMLLAVPILRNTLKDECFNLSLVLPFELRTDDFKLAMQDVYDFFYDVNTILHQKGLRRFEDMLRPAACSGFISDMLSASLAKHSRSLTENQHFNGHPDLIVHGVYPNNAVASGEKGVEVKSTRRGGGAVDTHGARNQWMSVFVYEVDYATEPVWDRAPMKFTEVYIGQVAAQDFRSNPRGPLGTRTATLHREGLAKLRQNWLYKDEC
jgi:hypothetical protein